MKRRFIYGIFIFLGVMSMLYAIKIYSINGALSGAICGIGSGLFTSVAISMILTYESEEREKKKLLVMKDTIFSNLVSICVGIYKDKIYRINEFGIYETPEIKGVYKLYDDFSTYNAFEGRIEQLDFGEMKNSKKERIEKLLEISKVDVERLAAELKNISKTQYLIQGIITEEEYKKLLAPVAVESYYKYINNLDMYWKDGIIKYDECVKILRMTTFICSKVIAMFPNCISDVAKGEKNIS